MQSTLRPATAAPVHSTTHVKTIADALRNPPTPPSEAAYRTFRERYRGDPVGFAQDCITWRTADNQLTTYQLEALRLLQDHKKLAVRSPHGSGKCLARDEQLPLADGRLVRARDLVGTIFELLAVDSKLDVHIATARAWDNGLQPIVAITTEHGRTIRRTLNHPLWAAPCTPCASQRGAWIPAGELEEGSVVAIYTGPVAGCASRRRHLGLPEYMQWERVARIETFAPEPTVAISVPTYHTFLTEFVEHNTTFEAITALWFALTRDGDADSDWKVITTAGVNRQLTKYLWPEIHKWARRMKWALIGREAFTDDELLTMSIKLRTGEAFAVSSSDPTLIEGAHADHILYIFDEAKAIADATYDAAEGAFSGAVADIYGLACSTPGLPKGRFYNIHARKPGFEDWHIMHITLEMAVEAGRVSAAWALAREKQWGRKSSLYQNRVLGNFATEDAEGIIPLTWVEAANTRWQEWHDAFEAGNAEALDVAQHLTSIGVDVAREGADTTVLALRSGPVIIELRRYSREDTMATVGFVDGLVKARGGRSVVDVIGVGGGVVDRLRELECDVVAFNAASRSTATDRSGEVRFANLRAEAWWNMREMLDPDFGSKIALPPDELLTSDLVTPRWKMTSRGILVESKDDLRKPERLGRSTNDGDAVITAMWTGDNDGWLVFGALDE